MSIETVERYLNLGRASLGECPSRNGIVMKAQPRLKRDSQSNVVAFPSRRDPFTREILEVGLEILGDWPNA